MQFNEQLCTDAILHILGSLYPDGDQRLSSFMFGTPGAPHSERRFAAEIFVREHQYIEALLFLRRHGTAFLKDISMGSLRSMATEFITEHYAYIAEGRPLMTPGLSLAQQISPQGLTALLKSFLSSSLFNPTNNVTIYPLVPVTVKDQFQSNHFALTGSDGLTAALGSFAIYPRSLLPDQFPPFEEMQGQPKPTSNWLCVNAPDKLIARKHACTILGALALAPIRRERYLQTGRLVHGGVCTISAKTLSCSPGSKPMTPSMPSDIIITQADHPWLDILSTLLDSAERTQKSYVRALEYFHRAWFDDPRERFPILCMALDSLVAAPRRHTAAAVEFVKSMINKPIDQDRLYLLMKLRGAVVHGAAPDVYESQYYEAYYSAYGEDPLQDLELVVAHCLRQRIFEGKLTAHLDPHAELIRRQQDLGRIPRNIRERSIIADE